jgi:hypothetical protein
MATAIDIRVIIAISGDISEIFIEAAIRRPAPGSKTNVPLTETTAYVSGF